jgi:hypothetical protein
MERAMKNGNGNGGGDAGRDERLQIMLSPSELEALDTFRFAHRMPSRAAAVRELLRIGMTAAGSEAIATAGTRSSDYGVLGGRSSQRAKSK